MCPEHAGVLAPPHSTPSPCDLSSLDKLAVTALQQAGNHSVDHLFSLATEFSTLFIVYIAVACSDIRKPNARTMFTVYLGMNHPSNDVLQVLGQQNKGGGSIAALVQVFQVSPLSQTLFVYSTSQYAIRAFTHSVPGNSNRGWQCPNSDLLLLGVAFLQQRTAAVQLRWLPNDEQNGHLLFARDLALKGLSNGEMLLWDIPPLPLHPSNSITTQIIPGAATVLLLQKLSVICPSIPYNLTWLAIWYQFLTLQLDCSAMYIMAELESGKSRLKTWKICSMRGQATIGGILCVGGQT